MYISINILKFKIFYAEESMILEDIFLVFVHIELNNYLVSLEKKNYYLESYVA